MDDGPMDGDIIIQREMKKAEPYLEDVDQEPPVHYTFNPVEEPSLQELEDEVSRQGRRIAEMSCLLELALSRLRVGTLDDYHIQQAIDDYVKMARWRD